MGDGNEAGSDGIPLHDVVFPDHEIDDNAKPIVYSVFNNNID
jgi:hypothetical protein